MSAQHAQAVFAAAHMAERRHQQHAAAINWRKLWQALNRAGFGWHQDAKGARERMRDCILTARHYRKGQRHYAAIAKVKGGAA